MIRSDNGSSGREVPDLVLGAEPGSFWKDRNFRQILARLMNLRPSPGRTPIHFEQNRTPKVEPHISGCMRPSTCAFEETFPEVRVALNSLKGLVHDGSFF
jgi:hypothetical protein